MLFANVNDDHQTGNSSHIADAGQRSHQTGALFFEEQHLFFLELIVGIHPWQFGPSGPNGGCSGE